MKIIRKRLLSALITATVIATSLPTLGVSAVESKENLSSQMSSVRASGTTETVERKVVAYFPEWAYTKEANDYYTADRMPWDKITHINYAFAHVGKDNKIGISDKVAALQAELPGQTSDFPYKGHFNVLNSYKKKYPNVKTMISIGGWAESSGFYTMCQTPEGRQTFANSVVDFLKEYGFDGADIDYEYPTSVKESGNPIDFPVADPMRGRLYNDYLEMMKVLRDTIDEASVRDGKKYLLTAAITASGWVLAGMGRGEYVQYLDYLNLMSYDYHGSWDGYVAHNSPLYSDPEDPATTGMKYNYLSTDWSVKYFSGLMDPSKIVVGIPYYTRGWEGVKPGKREGGLYGSAWKGKVDDSEGTGAVGIDNIWHDKLPDGSEEPGGSNPLWHVKNLLADKNLGYQRFWDDKSKVPYVWNENKKVFLSFEDEQSMGEKMDYIVNNNLGGAMIWEIDGDFSKDSTGKYVIGDTLTTIAKNKLDAAGPLKIEEKTNTLPLIDFDMDIEEVYDHPYGEDKIIINNKSGATINAPWKLEFDVPNTVNMDGLSSGEFTINQKKQGNNIHFTITSAEGWGKALGTGKTTLAEGQATMKVASAPQNMVLNGKASKTEWDRINSGKDKLMPSAVLTSTNHSKDGKYEVTVKVPENSNGQTVELYEGNAKIKTENINSSEKTFNYQMTGKQSGTYNYKVVIKGNGKERTSRIASVYVGPDIEIKAPTVVTSTSKSLDGKYTVTVNVPSGSNGTTLDFYENGALVKTEVINNSMKDFTYSMTGKKTGSFTYSAVIRNTIFSKESNIATVKVKIVDNYPAWDSAVGYTKQGEIVIYNGRKYEFIGWWSSNEAPDKNPNKWKDLGVAITDDGLLDLSIAAEKYNIQKGEAGYSIDYDLNKDNIIDIYDIVLISKDI
ncbi:glycosyl hydrolase family 18 protein [Clostridium paraputrificum]|uniref:glycosyl hydrolase family 18 protein n=1 Tax=Clostridium paraputrificum TaxID=29363 RepID=UPI003D32BE31